jgi:tRNA-modifying protein YgfZ
MALTAPLELDRAVFPLRGPEAEDFLQNLLTQNVSRLQSEPVIYTGLLTPQGKVAFDFMLWRADEGYLVDIAASRAADLIQRLTLYRLRAKVEIGPVDPARSVWAGRGETLDPRLSALGAREINTAVSPPADEPETYRVHRIQAGVPDLLRDGEDSESFALEALFEEFNGVDFQKGCFVGQENVSRMKRRATTRRKFCPVTFEGAPPAFGATIHAGPAEIGAVRGAIDGRALALLRLDRAAEAMAKGDALIADGKVLTLDPPAWLIVPD